MTDSLFTLHSLLLWSAAKGQGERAAIILEPETNCRKRNQSPLKKKHKIQKSDPSKARSDPVWG